MKIVAFDNRIDDMKSSSTLRGGLSDQLRFKQSSRYIARARTLRCVLSSGQGQGQGSSRVWQGNPAPALTRFVASVVF